MGAVAGIKVLDVATIFAGPLAGTLLADFGADVIKIEHPRGDPLRHHGPVKDGHGLWWKSASRNKRCITLNLSTDRGQELFRELAREADVVIENFRPGVMERWSLGYDELARENPGLVMLRVTGFGQFGPYSGRAGFGTLAEAMSGFAHITGEADGPPTLPPFGLADGIAGLTGAFAVMCALYNRDANGGVGQYIDLAIIEPIVTILGAQATAFDQLGLVQQRVGNRTPNNAPRNTYRTKDDRWVAISTSTNPIAERVMHLVGHPEFIEQDWFSSSVERAAHSEELDQAVGGWIAERTEAEVMAAFEDAGAAIAPIYDIERTLDDPQYQALNTFLRVEDADLGPLLINGLMFRMSATPGAVAFAGRRLGEDNDAVFGELGHAQSELETLREDGII
jgi:crotonobetainyl-CoA:carnitine CoA-transferase CaiB-like acyl-CoA transferase